MILANTEDINDVYLAGYVGKDERGRRMVSQLEDNGVEFVVQRIDSHPTTKIRCFVFDDKKPQYSHEDAAIEQISPQDVSDEIWSQTDHLHMTSVSPDMMLAFAQRARESEITVSFNPTQGYHSTGYQDVIEIADLVQMNRAESETFRQRNGPLGTVVDELSTDVVITHGPAGCTMHSKRGVASHPGYPNAVNSVVDTVGAGDSFMSGLLYCWVNDDELSESLKIANAYGARAVSVMSAPDSIDSSAITQILEKSPE